MGDFEALNVNGEITKNGGNVVSYFCTPSGRVIHAVLGPVDGTELLAEAQWAVNNWEQALKGTRSPRVAQQRLAAAHREKLPADLRSQIAEPSSGPRLQFTKTAVARRTPAAELSLSCWNTGPQLEDDQKVHQLLAEKPLPLLNDVAPTLFLEVGEMVADSSELIESAQAKFKVARSYQRPVLFVFDLAGQGRHSLERLDAKLLKQFVVVVAERDKLPALSRGLDLPAYEFKSDNQPHLVAALSDGQPLGVIESSAGREAIEEFLAASLADYVDRGKPRRARQQEIARLLQQAGHDELAARLQP